MSDDIEMTFGDAMQLCKEGATVGSRNERKVFDVVYRNNHYFFQSRQNKDHRYTANFTSDDIQATDWIVVP